MVLYPDKCQIIVHFTYNGTTIECSKGEKFDNKLTFKLHFRNIIKKPNQKFHALNRVKRYMGFEQNKLTSAL